MSERIPRPEEIVVDPDERTDEQTPKPLRCQAGSKTPDGGCQRDATTWMHPHDHDYALCDEHARLQECADEANEWSLVEEITRDWLRVADAWRIPELEQLAINANEHAKLEYLKAHAREELAEEIADAHRKSSRRRNAPTGSTRSTGKSSASRLSAQSRVVSIDRAGAPYRGLRSF